MNFTPANKTIKEHQLFPAFSEFQQQFTLLNYSKKSTPSNMKCKYALDCFYEKSELYVEGGSIEHIYSEKNGESALNIGNLILLENPLNVEADSKEINEKLVIYKKSNYNWIANFVEENQDWTSSDIERRAKDLAKIYYTKIIGKAIEEK